MSSDENTRLLRMIVRLLSLQLVADPPTSGLERSQRDKIKILGSAGLTSGEIAELLGTTPNTVSVALSNIKRDKLAKRAKSVKKVRALPAPAALDDDESIDDQ